MSSDEIATPRSSQFVEAPFTEKLSARQVNGLWFMCLIKTLLNALVDTLKVLKDLCCVVTIILAEYADCLSICDEQFSACE